MNLIQRIDALLPQTQCGKCGHPGCKPYAEGIARGEPINQCPPGGKETIASLAQLLNVAVLELDTSRGEAPAQVAFIREAECIGCTKCIQACPVDAIVGAAKLMHTVIIDECTGCDLCVAPCPVDCIDMRPLANGVPMVGGMAMNDAEREVRGLKRDRARRRFEQRNTRLRREEERKLAERQARTRQAAPVHAVAADPTQAAQEAAVKKAKISVAMSRAQLHKSLKAFGHPPTFEQQSQLVILQQQFEAAERALQEAEAVSDRPRPAMQRVEKRSVDSQLRQLKTALAYARADLSKLQRQPGASEAQLNEAQRTFDAAQRLVDNYTSA